MNNKLTESQELILEVLNSYLIGMRRLHSRGVYDEISEDIAAIESTIIRHIDGEEPDKESLLIYFGDEERAELVLSYFNIAKYLLQNGATLDI